MRDRSGIAVLFFCLAMAHSGFSAAATGDAEANQLIARASGLRADGQLDLAIDALTAASHLAQSDATRGRAEGELGATLFEEHRYEDAETHLRVAYGALAGDARAAVAIDLGNLATVRHDPAGARRFYEEGAQSREPKVWFSAQLDLVRLSPAPARLALLERLAPQLGRLPDDHDRAFYGLNLGDQAAQLGNPGLPLAYQSIETSRKLADRASDVRLQVESRDALAQLYERQGRDAEALALSQGGLEQAKKATLGRVADLVVALEWRQGRILARQKRTDLAIAAYRRAVDQIQAVRQDIPIAYENGQSSFGTTLEPVYLGLVDLLLRQSAELPSESQNAALHSVKDVLELLKQAEMQDYLGDRCTVDALQAGTVVPAQGTAFLYPILLPDRTELLLETADGITRATVRIGEPQIASTVRAFAESLRNDRNDYRPQAKQLYDWLIAPLDATFEAEHVQTLVVVSDGVLRLIPIGSLYDGRQFVIERFAVATVTGLSMTNASPPSTQKPTALIAGLSLPGPVVSKLRSLDIGSPDSPPTNAAVASTAPSTRALRFTRATTPNRAAEQEAERQGLALPGVQQEVQSLTQTTQGVGLLNADFTDARFNAEAGSGDYRIVHIASHGYFGGSAQESFILTYDDLLTLGDLQSLLQSREYRQSPIELLSLSACETAEGNERSPLGISGAAMKARAKSVLGTLWPVEDEAARAIMEQFYTDLESGHYSKAQALRSAQLSLLHQSGTEHPFYWAPFVLIGNWL